MSAYESMGLGVRVGGSLSDCLPGGGGAHAGTAVGGPGSGFGCYSKGQEQTINNHTEEGTLLRGQKLQENSPGLGAGQGKMRRVLNTDCASLWLGACWQGLPQRPGTPSGWAT